MEEAQGQVFVQAEAGELHAQVHLGCSRNAEWERIWLAGAGAPVQA